LSLGVKTYMLKSNITLIWTPIFEWGVDLRTDTKKTRVWERLTYML
jgi:hypothetical protein